jgi:hypothetical protein
VGAEIGTGVMGGNIGNVTGNALWNGASTLAWNKTIGAVAGITLVNTFGLTDTFLLMTYGIKLNHEAWPGCDFKLITLAGGTAAVTT